MEVVCNTNYVSSLSRPFTNLIPPIQAVNATNEFVSAVLYANHRHTNPTSL